MTVHELNGLKEFIDNLSIIDTHEHFMNKGFPHAVIPPDIFTFLGWSYVGADFVKAGSADIYNIDISQEKKWAELEKTLPYVRSTTYFRNMFEGLMELFNISEPINRSNWREYDRAFKSNFGNKEWFNEVIKKAKIEKYLADEFWSLEIPKGGKELVPVMRLNSVIYSALGKKDHNGNSARALAEKQSKNIKTLDDYVNWIDKRIAEYKKAGAVALKNAMAYDRSIFYAEVAESEAKKIFKNGLKKATPEDETKLQDFLMHRIMELSVKHSLPVQIHTGIQAGGGIPLDWSNPIHLNNLFIKYKKARFDIFHAGYPFTDTLIVLAKNFENVNFNLCWMTIISETKTEELLNELLDCVPSNKIFWGGDCFMAEAAYGAVKYAKRSIFRTLVRRIENGAASVEDAKFIAKNIMHDNANKFYGL